jgi:hypothetical protein
VVIHAYLNLVAKSKKLISLESSASSAHQKSRRSYNLESAGGVLDLDCIVRALRIISLHFSIHSTSSI